MCVVAKLLLNVILIFTIKKPTPPGKSWIVRGGFEITEVYSMRLFKEMSVALFMSLSIQGVLYLYCLETLAR